MSLPAAASNLTAAIVPTAPEALEASEASEPKEFYVVSLHKADRARRHRYLTFWRPDHRGYTYCLAWAGRYSREHITQRHGYLNNGETTLAVPCQLIDSLGEHPLPGWIDGNKGAAVRNLPSNWKRLQAARLRS